MIKDISTDLKRALSPIHVCFLHVAILLLICYTEHEVSIKQKEISKEIRPNFCQLQVCPYTTHFFSRYNYIYTEACGHTYIKRVHPKMFSREKMIFHGFFLRNQL